MTKAEKVKSLFGKDHIFNVSRIERQAGIRTLKLYEFLRGERVLDDEQLTAILNIIKIATKLQK